jgi:hypothetical protein
MNAHQVAAAQKERDDKLAAEQLAKASALQAAANKAAANLASAQAAADASQVSARFQNVACLVGK